MPRYNRLRASGEQEYTERDSYLFRGEDHDPVSFGKLGPQAHTPVASSGSVSPGSGPPSSGSPDEGGSDAAEKDANPKGNADASPAGRKAAKEVPDLDESADGVREKSVQRKAAQNGPSEYGGGRFGATLHRVTSFRESSKQSKYSRLADGGGEWEKESGEGEGEKVDPWGGRGRGSGHESDWLSTFSAHKAASTRDEGSWAAAVQRSASMRDAGGYAPTLETHFRGSTNPFERHQNHVPDSSLAPAHDSRNVFNGPGTWTNPFERSSANMERANGNGYSRGRGGGFGEEPISVPNMDRDRDEMPSSLGAAVQRALSLREGHLTSASSRSSYQRFHQAQGPDYSTPVFSNSNDRQGSWEQQPEHRLWSKGHSQSMRYDRVSLPASDPDEDFGYRSSSVGERDRNAGMTAAAVLQRAASVRDQVPSRAALTSARVYSMREQSHILQCSTCGRGLEVHVKGVPGPEDTNICQACSKLRVASHWTDPANGRYAVPAWAVPPKKKKGILHTCRRLLGLKTASTATAR